MIAKQFDFQSIVFQSLLVACLILFFWAPHGSDIALVLVVLSFLVFSKGRVLTGLEKNFLAIFLISILAVIVLAVVHFGLLKSSANEYGKTLFKIGIFGVFALVVDAVAFQFNYFKISHVKFVKVLIYAVFLSVILNFIWAIVVHPNVPLIDLFLGGSRRSFLGLMINANHADDLFVLQITILLFCNSVLLASGKKEPIMLFISALFILYFIYTIGVLGSRGGLVGYLVGLVLVVLLLAASKNLKSSAVYLSLLISVFVFMPQKHYTRLVNNLSISDFVKNLENDTKIKPVQPKLNITSQNNLAPNKNFQNLVKNLEQKASKPSKLTANKPTQKKLKTPKVEKCNMKEMIFGDDEKGGLDKSSKHRISLWVDGFYAGSQKPIWGHGEYNKHRLVDDYELKSPCNIKYFSHMHNFYLDLFIRGGVFLVVVFVGLAMFLMSLLLRVLISNNQYNLVVVPIVAHLIYLFISNVFDLTFFRTSELLNVLLCVAVLCGISFALQNSEQNSGKHKT